MDQIAEMLALVNQKIDKNVDIVVGPETAIPNGMWETEMNEERTVRFLRA